MEIKLISTMNFEKGFNAAESSRLLFRGKGGTGYASPDDRCRQRTLGDGNKCRQYPD